MSIVTELLNKRQFQLNEMQKQIAPIIENSNKNVVISALTGSGKTLLAEIGMYKAIKEGKSIIYLVPLKALGNEKYTYFKEFFDNEGYKTTIRSGDYDSEDDDLPEYDVVIATYEKMDSLLRHRNKFIEKVGLIVVDESHSIGDTTRGSTLEILLTRLMIKCQNARIICLTAVMQNSNELAKWLNAEFCLSTWRAVPLAEGVSYWEGNRFTIMWKDGRRDQFEQLAPDLVTSLALQTIAVQQAQVLIACMSRKETYTMSRRIAPEISKCLTEDEKEQLNMLAEHINNRELAEFLKQGVAVHNASLNKQQRLLIEEAFKRRILKAISSTSTLFQGLNLPARRVIVVNIKRFNPYATNAKEKFKRIPKYEYSNLSGRAGRYGLDPFGETILLGFQNYCKNCNSRLDNPTQLPQKCFRCGTWAWYDDTAFSLLDYLKQPNELIKSQLGDEFQMFSHVLSEVSIDQPISIDELRHFFSLTFGAKFQRVEANVEHALELDMDKLGLIYKDNEQKLHTSLMGRLVAMTYINPLSYATINHYLMVDKEYKIDSWLQHIIECPDFKRGAPQEPDYVKVLKYWIDGHEMECHTTNSCGVCIKDITGTSPGDIHLGSELGQWIANAAGVIAAAKRMPETVKQLQNLEIRLKYGVTDNLLDLCKIPFVGREISRKLFDYGITDRKMLRDNIDEESVKRICFRYHSRIREVVMR